MIVKNPRNLPLIDYRKLIPIQEELKDLSESNYQKLLNSLKRHGYFVPAFVWIEDDKHYILDAHQRLRVLKKEGIEFENTGYEIPFVEIEASNMLDAKAKLLVLTSQYGTVTMEGYDMFTVDLPEMDLQNIHFDALQFVGEKPPEQDEKVECPTCGSQVKAEKIKA